MPLPAGSPSSEVTNSVNPFSFDVKMSLCKLLSQTPLMLKPHDAHSMQCYPVSTPIT
jgi:hypothetical protein